MRGWWTLWATSTALLLGRSSLTMANYQNFDPASQASIKSSAALMADDMLSFYNGDQPGGTPGLISPPYYWWEAGAMMGALIDYWYYTGDSRFNQLTTDGLLWQVGPNNDYMPPNQTMTEGNDDQGFWGMAVMSAAEYKFPDPPPDQPQWLALAQAVFNTQAPRWDSEDCGGGLRWQIFTWNNGFTYKNSISNACFFNLAARLALYTGNQSYADWAEKTWDWMVQVKFMDDSYYVYDGADIGDGCKKRVPYQFSYNAGAFLLGAAAMYNYSTGAEQAKWQERTEGLLNGTKVFFVGEDKNIMSEVACEPVNLCNIDQQSFKAYLSRWMAATTKWAPWTHDTIMPLLESTAIAAVSQCTGGDNGRMCGLRWQDGGKWDNTTGLGQQMAVMEVVLANMIKEVSEPVTNRTGGTSQGDPGAGGSDVGRKTPWSILELMPPITTADRAGAYILTVAVLLALIAAIVYMMLDENSEKTPAEVRSDIKAFFATGAAKVPAMRKRTRREKGKDVERSDSNRSSGVPSFIVLSTPSSTLNGPRVIDSPHQAARLHKDLRSVMSDPGMATTARPGLEGLAKTAEKRLSYGRSQSMAVAVAKRNSIRNQAARRPTEDE